MRWSRRVRALLTELALLGVVVLGLLLSHALVGWFAPGDEPQLPSGPQRCVVTIGDPWHTSPVLDLASVTDGAVCFLQQRTLMQMQGVQVWSDAGEVRVTPYARLAGQQFPLPPGGVVFAADSFGISGVHLSGAPRYVHIIFRYTIHAYDLWSQGTGTNTVQMTPTCAARCWRAVEGPTP